MGISNTIESSEGPLAIFRREALYCKPDDESTYWYLPEYIPQRRKNDEYFLPKREPLIPSIFCPEARQFIQERRYGLKAIPLLIDHSVPAIPPDIAYLIVQFINGKKEVQEYRNGLRTS